MRPGSRNFVPLAALTKTAFSWSSPVSRQSLIAFIVLLAVAVGGFLAYQAYERDQNTLDISVGQDGVKID